MNVVPYFVYAALIVVRDFELEPVELGPVEGGHLNDTFADRKRQLCVLVESSRCGSEHKLEVGMLYLLSRTGDWKKRLENGQQT